MKILQFTPHLNTVYAGRTISAGYKNAFMDLYHDFRFLTADDTQEKVYKEFSPDIIFLSLNSYILRFLDVKALSEQKKAGSKIFVNIPFWTSPFGKTRINEAAGLKNNPHWIDLIRSGTFGDIYFSFAEQEDDRMNGFQKSTGYPYYTIPLAADKLSIFPDYDKNFTADISYIGTYLPEKREFIKNQVFPLKDKYNLKLYGQDWSAYERFEGFISKVGKYYNLPVLKDIQKPKLKIEDERKIYTSSVISINMHEDYQKRFGGDCNERTFKIPLAGGLEITDDVQCIRNYFVEGKEIIIAKDKDDWFDKINYYMKNAKKRLQIIEAGRKKVLKEHTYHNRVESFLKLYEQL
jgi:spore maturation protein CgeB